jgi:anti-sigma B factor antagonist
MPIEVVELDIGVTKVVLTGRIDIAGAQAIDMPMNIIGGSRRAVVIDLAGVEFMASMGLRSVVMCARSVQSKRGKVVLLAPRPEVLEVIQVSGVDELIPVFASEAEALAAVFAG